MIFRTATRFGYRVLRGVATSAAYGYVKRRGIWYYRILLDEDFSYIITRYYKRHKVVRDVDRDYKRKEQNYGEFGESDNEPGSKTESSFG